MEIQDLYKVYLDCSLRVATDSRTVSGGELFFALKGENFDGDKFAADALQKGAAYAVVSEAADLEPDPRLIRVADTFAALQQLAIWHRKHVQDGALKVIGLTGTNGKTTTKELISAVLARKYKISATAGNFNNDIGVPLTLLSIRPDTEIAVVEMGANHPDDIAKLVKVSQPDYGLITNVGKAHLLGFGSIEGVKAAKGELYKWLGATGHGVIFLNEDDANLREMAATVPCHCYGYGLKHQGATVLPVSAEHPAMGLSLDGCEIHTHLVGAYNAANVLAAIAVGDYFGVQREESIAAIEGYVPTNNRSQMVVKPNATLIVDAYNANPSSMAAALDNFAAMGHGMALLGEMRELGAESAAEHISVVKRLQALGLDAMLVGEEFKKAVLECGASFPCFNTSDELAQHLKDHPVSASTILVKGSRGTKMEKTLEHLG